MDDHGPWILHREKSPGVPCIDPYFRQLKAACRNWQLDCNRASTRLINNHADCDIVVKITYWILQFVEKLLQSVIVHAKLHSYPCWWSHSMSFFRTLSGQAGRSQTRCLAITSLPSTGLSPARSFLPAGSLGARFDGCIYINRKLVDFYYDHRTTCSNSWIPKNLACVDTRLSYREV